MPLGKVKSSFITLTLLLRLETSFSLGWYFLGKSETVYGLQGHRVTRLSFSPKRMENKSTLYAIKVTFTLVQQLASSARRLLKKKKAGETPNVFSTVAALCKVACRAFNTTGAAVVKVVGALYRG